MSSNDHDIRVLNGLIGALTEASGRYRSSAAEGRDPALGFNRYAESHDAVVRELTAEVTSRGGAVGGAGDLFSQAGQAIAALFHAPAGGGSAAEDAEDIEAALMARFETAMADDATSGPVRDAIVRMFDTVKANHDEALQAKLRLSGEA